MAHSLKLGGWAHFLKTHFQCDAKMDIAAPVAILNKIKNTSNF